MKDLLYLFTKALFIKHLSIIKISLMGNVMDAIKSVFNVNHDTCYPDVYIDVMQSVC